MKKMVMYIHKTDVLLGRWHNGFVFEEASVEAVKHEMKRDGTLDQYLFFDLIPRE